MESKVISLGEQNMTEMKEELEIMRGKVKYKLVFFLLKVIRRVLGHGNRNLF